MQVNPDTSIHEKYIRRCIAIAKRASKDTQTNPMVGAVLVHQNRIIGEGYHMKYGAAHAEVNALNSVSEDDKKFIKESTLYVSLEPCCIHRKTPACTDLIIKHSIPHIVISTLDPNPEVAGKGVNILKENGCDVVLGILENEGKQLIRKFQVHLQKRPYVILKFAQSDNRFIGVENQRIKISNDFTNKLVHQWRSEINGILVGTQTAIVDNPRLTTREIEGSNPIRIVLDRDNKIPKTHHLWADDNETWFVNQLESNLEGKKKMIQQDFEEFSWQILLTKLFEQGIYTIMIEGGAKTLNSIIKDRLWDEARVITSTINIENGIKAPVIIGRLVDKIRVKEDTIDIVYPHMSVN